MNPAIRNIFLCLLLWPLSQSHAQAYSSPHLEQLEACGQGDLKAFGLFTVGEGTLFRQDCEQPWDISQEEARGMTFRYERKVPAHAFAESAEYYLKRNGVSIGEPIRKFHQAYQAIDSGDTYAILYAPDKGLRLQLNGEDLATLEDDTLARQYFSIWLGDRPFDEDLKAELLGEPADSFW